MLKLRCGVVCNTTLCFTIEDMLIQQSTLSSFTEQATQGQTTLLVVTGGTVKFEGNKQRFFNQNFLLTAQATPNNDQPVWKIASDCFRFQDWNSWGFPYLRFPLLKCTHLPDHHGNQDAVYFCFCNKMKNVMQHWIQKWCLFSKCWTSQVHIMGVINTHSITKRPTVKWLSVSF